MSGGPKPTCPLCGERKRIELISAHGSQLITAQWYCGACSSYFEAIRDDFAQA